MANIHKGKSGLKKVTINDIAYKDRPKNQIFMQETSKGGLILDQSTAIAVERKSLLAAQELESTNRREYNSKLTDLDPIYAELDPLGDFIIRYAVRPIPITDGLSTYQQRMVRGVTANGHPDDPVPDPFEFQQVAVIVAAPEHEKVLTPGSLVQVATADVYVDNRQVVGFKNNYVHPSYTEPMVPQVCTHQHFGYAIVSRGWMRVKLSSSYAELLAK